MVQLALCISLLLCLYPWGISSESKEEFMSGAVLIKEPESRYPLMYRDVIPLLYKFRVPKWDDLAMKIQFWKEHNNCTDNDRYSSGYPCPILNHMHPIAHQFLKNMTSWKNLYSSGKHFDIFESISGFLNELMSSDSRLCSMLRIEPHFRGQAFTTAAELNKYVEIMTSCGRVNGTVINLKEVDMSNLPKYLEVIYHDAFKSFTADYWNILPDMASKESASLLGWTALQAGLLTHQNMEVQKWTLAVDICKRYRVPWTLISADSLLEQLATLKPFLSSQYKALAVMEKDIQKYFQLPLADCIFGDDDTFLVRIMVPLVPIHAGQVNFFLRVNPIPFSIPSGKICSLWDVRDSVPYSIALQGTLPCNCEKTDTFCQAWVKPTIECPHEHRRRETCALAVANTDEKSVLKDCPLYCQYPDYDFNEMVVMYHSDLTKIQAIPSLQKPGKVRMIKCGSQKMLRPDPDEQIGAYEIMSPDNCYFEYVSRNSSEISEAVDNIDGVQAQKILPFHWRGGWYDASPFNKTNVTVPTILQELEDFGGNTLEKLSYLAVKLQAVNESIRCPKAIPEYASNDNNVGLWIAVVFSLLANALLAALVTYILLWKRKQHVTDPNKFALIPNAAEFPISDDLPRDSPN